MIEVLCIAQEATNKGDQHKGFCALMTLDVRNAFNVARWSGILSKMERRKIDRHLREITRSYLSNRGTDW